MGRDDVPARRGRVRQRKQNLSVKEVCTAPVIELTSSSEDDDPSPPPPPPRPVLRKSSQPSKPPILAKRGPGRPRTRFLNLPNAPKTPTEKEKKKLTDTETLLSILESNDEDEIQKDLVITETKSVDTGNDKSVDKAKQDKLMKSIEDELRFLDQVDVKQPKTTQSRPGETPLGNASSDKPASVKSESGLKDDYVHPKVRKVENTFNGKPSRRKDVGSSRDGLTDGRKPDTEITSFLDDSKNSEHTKLLSPSQIKLPPEVLEAIKKRTDLGRIEKIVEKTDSNQKSKYIVIFNKSGAKAKRKGTIEEEIEELLKSLPEKPTTAKKPKLDERNRLTRTSNSGKTTVQYQKSAAKSSSIFANRKVSSGNEDKKSLTVANDAKKSLSLTDMKKAHAQHALNKKSSPSTEEPVRFTESPLGQEPRLPWDAMSDGFDKYFKVVERLVEHHDSLDSDSEYEEPEALSHFKSMEGSLSSSSVQTGDNDQINVNNIADTVAREFPKWNVEPLPGTNTICLVRLGLDNRGVLIVRKQIKVDSEYNVSVVVDNSVVSEYEGMYDSFDSIKQLVHEVDAL